MNENNTMMNNGMMEMVENSVDQAKKGTIDKKSFLLGGLTVIGIQVVCIGTKATVGAIKKKFGKKKDVKVDVCEDDFDDYFEDDDDIEVCEGEVVKDDGKETKTK